MVGQIGRLPSVVENRHRSVVLLVIARFAAIVPPFEVAYTGRGTPLQGGGSDVLYGPADRVVVAGTSGVWR